MLRSVKTVGELMDVAMMNGFAMEDYEADRILSYMEGHGYAIMADEKGTTYRFDMDSGQPYDEEEPEYYTLSEVVDFCINANEELTDDLNIPFGMTRATYLEELQDDAAILEELNRRLN